MKDFGQTSLARTEEKVELMVAVNINALVTPPYIKKNVAHRDQQTSIYQQGSCDKRQMRICDTAVIFQNKTTRFLFINI